MESDVMERTEIVVENNPQGISFSASITRHLQVFFDAHEGDLPSTGLYNRIIGEVERCLIDQTLIAVEGNQLRAAEVLGINRNTLRKKIRQLGVDLPLRQKK